MIISEEHEGIQRNRLIGQRWCSTHTKNVVSVPSVTITVIPYMHRFRILAPPLSPAPRKISDPMPHSQSSIFCNVPENWFHVLAFQHDSPSLPLDDSVRCNAIYPRRHNSVHVTTQTQNALPVMHMASSPSQISRALVNLPDVKGPTNHLIGRH